MNLNSGEELHMKRLATIFAAVTFVAGTAFAATVADTYKYEAKNGAVIFNHKAHSDRLKDCAKCHAGTPGKLDLNKDSAHKMCKGCHEVAKAGPTKCNECHKK